MDSIKTQSFHGLTAKEVEDRQKNGQVNTVRQAVSKPLSRIFTDNICTLFNFVNVLIAAALIAVGSYHNLLFFGVVLCNTVIGIVQEIRSKRTLEKLSLLCAAKATVLRDGKEQLIPAADIVKDDVLLFHPGDQISVDAEVLEGEAEADESLLTGEIDPVVKRRGDKLLSGSFLVGGHCVAVATCVGDDSYAAKLTAAARKHKRLSSQLLTAVNKIIRFTGVFMIPFAALLLLGEWYSGAFDVQTAVTSTAAALIGMMPQGLILLTTVSLMVGVIKLAKKKTLVRELYCIETLSRVSLLCLDKTGTITKGSMTVSGIVPLDSTMTEQERDRLIASAVSAIGDNNATATAIDAFYRAHGVTPQEMSLVAVSPFSSDRKWSAAAFAGVGAVFLGAFDRLLPECSVPDGVRLLEEQGKRILAVAFSPCEDIEKAKDSLSPLAVIVLEDELRDNAEEIVSYFQNEGVTLRVISGDHPRTVAAIAQKAGIKNAHLAVDASTLTTPEELADAARTYTVFGRVMPEQKKVLVQLFKEQGHTVAMTGDGVNDVPALKEADCSVAMAAGSDAAKQVSQIVLLDSDFAALPSVVMEGRRVVNNITRTASLFLVKTVMSFLVTLCAIMLPMDYPFAPLQLTLVGMFAESIPGFFLTLEPSRERIKGNFLHTVFCSAVPSGVIITVFVVLVQLAAAPLLSLTADQSSTLCVYVTGFVWLVQLYRVCRPFTLARRVLWVSMTVGFFGGAVLLSYALPALFAALGGQMDVVFVLPTLPMLVVFAALAAVSFPLDRVLYRVSRKVWKDAA